MNNNITDKRSSTSVRGRVASNVKVLDPVSTSPTIIKVGKDNLSYVEALVKCAPIIKYCLLNAMEMQKCSLACLFDPFPVSKHVVQIVDTVVKFLCSPMETIYDTGMKVIQNNEKFMDISNYQDLLGITNVNYTLFSTFGPAALPMQLIKYARSPVFDSLKPALASLSNEIGFSATEFTDLSSFQNSACDKNSEMFGTVDRLAEKFIDKPSTVDITLPGWFLISTIGQFSVNPLSVMIHTILNMYKLLTGVQCSLIQYAETGVNSDCLAATGYAGFPNYSVGFKHQDDNDVSCNVSQDPTESDVDIDSNSLSKSKNLNDIRNTELEGKGFQLDLNSLNIETNN